MKKKSVILNNKLIYFYIEEINIIFTLDYIRQKNKLNLL